ncbi:OmpW family outer membrane protein [Persicitalea jodogahamensis]|uniref:Outer membrane protein beta-barrel domain-containing protein n=1 Tax=Persicitalea jodogahamensis TaxID=402147 RepID=A0A8J3D6H2_9BACT|nr:OmpW family outer membrane protein [Persicitalea jodogahamensis]GHB81455.1 hypothetical protein GCM10007390_40420 [Persicitalea jodogahamensis]
MNTIKILLLGLVLSAPALAQQNPQLYNLPSPYDRYSHYVATVRGGAGIPIGPFASGYVDKPTLRNYSFSVDWVLQKPISIGVEVGKTFYSQRLPRAIYQSEEGEISAVQTRTIDLMPIQGVVSYYFAKPNAMIRPYVQAAVGADLLTYSLYYGSLANQQQSVKLTYGGAAGAKFLFKKDGSVGADIRVKYNQTSLNYDYIDKGVGQINATVGLFYRWW